MRESGALSRAIPSHAATAALTADGARNLPCSAARGEGSERYSRGSFIKSIIVALAEQLS
jgi:hypothetical protein